MKKTLEDLQFLYANGFIGETQFRCVKNLILKSEEKQFFIDKISELKKRIDEMPKTYEQDGKGKRATAYLHYFVGGCDWYITEKDIDPNKEGQLQAFGVTNLGHGPEIGYINLFDVGRANAELDFHFKPTILAEIDKAAWQINNLADN